MFESRPGFRHVRVRERNPPSARISPVPSFHPNDRLQRAFIDPLHGGGHWMVGNSSIWMWPWSVSPGSLPLGPVGPQRRQAGVLVLAVPPRLPPPLAHGTTVKWFLSLNLPFHTKHKKKLSPPQVEGKMGPEQGFFWAHGPGKGGGKRGEDGGGCWQANLTGTTEAGKTQCQCPQPPLQLSRTPGQIQISRPKSLLRTSKNAFIFLMTGHL